MAAADARFAEGHLRLLTLGGAAVRVHWTLPLGMVLWTRFQVRPGAWLGLLILVLVHELGHAALVWRYRLRVVSIDLHAIGGECRWTGHASDRRRAIIAWGGVVAQAILGVATLAALALAPTPTGFGGDLVAMFLGANLLLIALNLLPIPPLDGARAWRLLRHRRAIFAPPPPIAVPPAAPSAPRVPVRVPAASPRRWSAEEELAAVEEIDRAEPVDSPALRQALDALVRKR